MAQALNATYTTLATGASAMSTGGGSCVLTMPSGQMNGLGRHAFTGLAYGYSGVVPTAGVYTLTVQDAGNTILQLPCNTSGLQHLGFGEAMVGQVNSALVLTLSAGGGSTQGYVNLLGYEIRQQ